MGASYAWIFGTLLLWAFTSTDNGNEERFVGHQQPKQALRREQWIHEMAERSAPAAVHSHTATSHPGVNNSKKLLLLVLTANQAAPTLNAEERNGVTPKYLLFGASPYVAHSSLFPWSSTTVFTSEEANSTNGSEKTVSATFLS